MRVELKAHLNESIGRNKEKEKRSVRFSSPPVKVQMRVPHLPARMLSFFPPIKEPPILRVLREARKTQPRRHPHAWRGMLVQVNYASDFCVKSEHSVSACHSIRNHAALLFSPRTRPVIFPPFPSNPETPEPKDSLGWRSRIGVRWGEVFKCRTGEENEARGGKRSRDKM